MQSPAGLIQSSKIVNAHYRVADESPAESIADFIADKSLDPDFILCSSARRARDTLTPLMQKLTAPLDVRIDDDLYGAEPTTILAQIKRIPNSAKSAMVIGHNPGLQDLVEKLTSKVPTELEEKFPTAALATIELPAESWRSVKQKSGKLVGYVTPRELE